MSAYCKDKDTTWDFIRRYLMPDSKSISGIQDAHIRIPLNRVAYRLLIMADQCRGGTHFIQLYTNGPLELVHKPTEEDGLEFNELVENTTLLYWPDNQLSESVWNAIAPYFSGDRTMDEVIDLVQRRVQLYVNEQR